MLTRLKVSGFKNLVDADVRFGPFTCITGANGAGKSNLFDAIKFLSALAERPFIEAALTVRDEGARTANLRNLFYHVGDRYAGEMSFEAEMIVPGHGVDALGQHVRASITFLRYAVTLAYREAESFRSIGALELIREELDHINIGDATKHLLFPNKPAWRRSVVYGRRATPFISTEGSGEDRMVILHQDGRSGGPVLRLAATLPRTVLSAANTAATPTALLARKEMQSWRLMQLEPSALRKPDEFTASTRLEADGKHLAATLYHLARRHEEDHPAGQTGAEAMAQTYSRVTARLSQLIDDIQAIWIDRDHRRELLTLYATDRDGTAHPAQALSDGTLRFLALAVLEMDPEAQGLLCMEEPENGIHPERMASMLRLLRDIASDTTRPVGPDNPLRQVIINTHSPAVISQVPDDHLLIAEIKDRGDGKHRRAAFSCIRETWRQKAHEPVSTVSRENLLSYLHLTMPGMVMPHFDGGSDHAAQRDDHRVSSLQLALFPEPG